MRLSPSISPSKPNRLKRGPGIFLQRHPPPAFINEVQYAPDLFRDLKVVVDAHRTRSRKAPKFSLFGIRNKFETSSLVASIPVRLCAPFPLVLR
jgi:hypothetical protein